MRHGTGKPDWWRAAGLLPALWPWARGTRVSSAEFRRLADLNEWLQCSRSLEELLAMVSVQLTRLLPGHSGSLYVYAQSRDVLEGRISWNGGSHHCHLAPEDCWGLRRGRTYAFGDRDGGFPCAHVRHDDARPHLCFPIHAHGEMIGLIHMLAADGVTPRAFFRDRMLAQMAAEQISLGIANVRMRDQLQRQSVRDPLTGLFNRRYLADRMRRLIEEAQSRGQPLSVLSIDVDHFKRFNDEHGHDAGDMVLRSVGALLERHCEDGELACRIGGEEFIVVLPDTTVDRALQSAELIRLAAETTSLRYGEKPLPRITVSIGVALSPVHGTNAQDILVIADSALYEAKTRGRNRVVLAQLPGETDHGLLTAVPDADPVPDAPAALPRRGTGG